MLDRPRYDNGQVLRAMILVVLMALFIGGCGVFVAPSPTAGEIGDVVAGLVRRGATITDQVSGDAGCSDSSLFGNAVRYDVRLGATAATSPVYVFGWKSQQTFDANAQAFQSCVDSYKQAHPDESVTTYEDSPWRAYGSNWSSDLTDAVKLAVHAAAGASAPEEPQ